MANIMAETCSWYLVHYFLIICILIVVLCILIVVFYVYLLLSSMYTYCCLLCILIVVYVFLDAATLTEVFPCFFLGCKANARVILVKTGHGTHTSKIVVLLYVLLFLLFYVLFVCKCVLPPGDNPIAVNKYILSYNTVQFWLYVQYIFSWLYMWITQRDDPPQSDQVHWAGV